MSVKKQRQNSVQPNASTVNDCLQRETAGASGQLLPWRVTRIRPEAAPQRIVEISSHMIELAMLANKCTDPPTIHNTYAIANNIVHIALNKKRIKSE
jgi:hypothetical protein